MRRLVFVWILCILIACAKVAPPVQEPPIAIAPQVQPENLTPPKQMDVDLPTRTVTQTGDAGTIRYHLTEDNRLLQIEKTGEVWNYHYANGILVDITGPQDIQFFYEKGKLTAIDVSPNRYALKYDVRDRLTELSGGRETVHFDYDSLDQIRWVRRGVAGKTSLDYDKKGKLQYITRGLVTTNVYYNDKGLVNNFDADDTKMIIGYWRDGKLISLAGKTFGQGISVSYGPDYPPKEADVIHEADKSMFTAAYKESLYRVVDDYLYCKYVRTLKDVPFEGLAYGFYLNYFNGGMVDYLRMQYECLPYES